MSDVIRSTPVSQQGNGNASMTVECSGHDRYLLVFINIVDASAGDRVLTIDFNGDNLTRLQGRVYSAGLAESEVWGLANPDEGSHTLTWTFAGGITEYQIVAIPLAQVDQSGALDTSSGSAGTGTSRSITLTTTADRCQLFSFLAADSSVSGVSANSGETEIATELDAISESHASEEDAVISPAGSESIGWSWSSSQANAMEAVAIKPTPNMVLHVPQLSLGITLTPPSVEVIGKSPAAGMGMVFPSPAAQIEAIADISDWGLSGLAPALGFRMVVKLHSGERKRQLSGEEKQTTLMAGQRRVVVMTEKRNE